MYIPGSSIRAGYLVVDSTDTRLGTREGGINSRASRDAIDPPLVAAPIESSSLHLMQFLTHRNSYTQHS